VRKLLRATLIVKRETSITGELWAAFTAAGAASTLAEIANFSRAQPPKRTLARGGNCPIFTGLKPDISGILRTTFSGFGDTHLAPHGTWGK
jgi:hypothetical protein